MGFLVDGPKVNGRGFLHAGTIAGVADVVIGHTLASTSDPPTQLVTVNLSCDLLGTAHLGDWVDIEVVPTRVGRRLAAGRATFCAGDRVIATASGLFVPQCPDLPEPPSPRVPPAGFEPATHGLGNRRSIP